MALAIENQQFRIRKGKCHFQLSAVFAEYFADLAEWLIIEFLPKSDKKVKRLLASREDIFDDYARDSFERTYSESFEIMQKQTIQDSDRGLYLMRRKTRTR